MNRSLRRAGAAVLALSLLGALAACTNDPLAEQYRAGDNKGFVAADAPTPAMNRHAWR